MSMERAVCEAHGVVTAAAAVGTARMHCRSEFANECLSGDLSDCAPAIRASKRPGGLFPVRARRQATVLQNPLCVESLVRQQGCDQYVEHPCDARSGAWGVDPGFRW